MGRKLETEVALKLSVALFLISSIIKRTVDGDGGGVRGGLGNGRPVVAESSDETPKHKGFTANEKPAFQPSLSADPAGSRQRKVHNV